MKGDSMTGLPDKPTIPDVIARFAAYREVNHAWGSLHIVLEDGNVKNADVEYCYQYAIDTGDQEGASLAKILLRMSKTQRLLIDSKVDKYNKGELK
jgi:hypothetical protein